jgi:hypothetical protein
VHIAVLGVHLKPVVGLLTSMTSIVFPTVTVCCLICPPGGSGSTLAGALLGAQLNRTNAPNVMAAHLMICDLMAVSPLTAHHGT